MSPTSDSTAGLCRFIDRSPSPYHAVAALVEELSGAGFSSRDLRDPWDPDDRGPAFVALGGALIAWGASDGPAHGGFAMIGAHTDSPNLRIRPEPDVRGAGFRQLGVEVYGSPLLNSWLDRDLGLSGRVMVADGSGAVDRLVCSPGAVLRVPQLAIHLDRGVNEGGLILNPQTHMQPIWGLDRPDTVGLHRWLGEQLEVDSDDILSWDLMTHDTTPARRIGVDCELISAPRLDNLVSCSSAVEALLRHVSLGGSDLEGRTPLVALFDHEEVGSSSTTGAAGPLLGEVIERLVLQRGGDASELGRSLRASICLSSDMAHGIHPNYVERHEPNHAVRVGGGPVVKINVNQRYATDAAGQARFELACRHAALEVQRYSNRGDLPCGSTIGPLTATRLGIATTDVGAAMLSMHSARELMAADDVDALVAAFTAWWSLSGRPAAGRAL